MITKWIKIDNNIILEKNKNTNKYFYISYAEAPVMADNQSDETALCVDDEFYILNGDYRKQYEPVTTRQEAMDIYNKYKDKNRSRWSTDIVEKENI